MPFYISSVPLCLCAFPPLRLCAFVPSLNVIPGTDQESRGRQPDRTGSPLARSGPFVVSFLSPTRNPELCHSWHRPGIQYAFVPWHQLSVISYRLSVPSRIFLYLCTFPQCLPPFVPFFPPLCLFAFVPLCLCAFLPPFAPLCLPSVPLCLPFVSFLAPTRNPENLFYKYASLTHLLKHKKL